MYIVHTGDYNEILMCMYMYVTQPVLIQDDLPLSKGHAEFHTLSINKT